MNIIYSAFLIPLLILILHIAALFSKRLRQPLSERNKLFQKLKNLKNADQKPLQKTIVIHTASMGEFEHIKPIIKKIKDEFALSIIVTFFSPSGYEHVKHFHGVDHFLYLPYDFQWMWKRFYKATNCKLLLISKHDVWPNQVKMAKKLGIKLLLVNASLSATSSRTSLFAKTFLTPAYKSLDKIFVISKSDEEQFINSFGCKNTDVVGDTKFDQVLIRKDAAEKQQLLNLGWISDNKVLVFGSLWPQDAEHVLKELPFLLDRNEKLKIIIVPHQPTNEIISIFITYFGKHKFSLFSNKINLDHRILIINSIGVLADMYKHADMAYVGGSFKQGIHNVLEPAIYEVPVFYGPNYKNSFEATQLLETGGSMVVNDSSQFMNSVQALLDDENLRKAKGQIAKEYAIKNTGSTQKILDYIAQVLK